MFGPPLLVSWESTLLLVFLYSVCDFAFYSLCWKVEDRRGTPPRGHSRSRRYYHLVLWLQGKLNTNGASTHIYIVCFMVFIGWFSHYPFTTAVLHSCLTSGFVAPIIEVFFRLSSIVKLANFKPASSLTPSLLTPSKGLHRSTTITSIVICLGTPRSTRY